MRISFTLEEAAEVDRLLSEYPVESMEGMDVSAEELVERLRGGNATESDRRMARLRLRLAVGGRETAKTFRELKLVAKGLAEDALRLLMMELSEEAMCAGWMQGLEYDLWSELHGTSIRRTYLRSDDDAKRLRQLSELCDGWIVWSGMDGPTLVPMDEWLQRYDTGVRESDG